MGFVVIVIAGLDPESPPPAEPARIPRIKSGDDDEAAVRPAKKALIFCTPRHTAPGQSVR
jgi:hypothetical protein